METTDVVKLKESGITTYQTENGNLKYSITKKIEESTLKSIVCAVNKETTAADGTKSNQYLGIAQLELNADGTRSKVYSFKEDCEDTATIIADFEIILSAVK